jgi:hypothetical protein
MSLPGAQVPLMQQPPLHGCPSLQVVVQVWLLKSQAWLAGQSVCTLQPQVPPATQAWPLALALQSMQALPLAPQLEPPVPALHTPPLQQPPLQGDETLQVVLHRFALQA